MVYSPMGQVFAAMQGQNVGVVYVPLPGGATAAYNAPGLSYYFHADWLGSLRLMSDTGRNAAPIMAYAPFGEGYAGGTPMDVEFTAGGYSFTVIDPENQTGSLQDFMFRRYNPVQGRWISPDPAGLAAVNPLNPQSWNRYAYVLNSPLNAIDPSGLDCVYLNDDGTSIEAIDPGTCDAGSGGYYIPGTVDPGSIIINSDNGTITAISDAWGGSLSTAGAEGSNVNGAWTQTYAVGLNGSSLTNNGMLLAGVLPPAANGALQALKQATRGYPPVTNPPTLPGPPKPPPDLKGWDLDAMEKFEKMIHGLMLMMEKGGYMFETIFVVVPAQELCEINHNCGPRA